MIDGAFDCIEQPMTATLLLTVVHNAVSDRGAEKERVASDDRTTLPDRTSSIAFARVSISILRQR
jgi:FixJ family two-component response regulator